MSPWVDLDDKSSSWTKNASIDYVDRRVWDYFAQGYAGLLPLSDPQVSPMNATLSGLPPMMISVGSCEVLYDQCVAFVQKLEDAGVIVELDEGEDMVHASQIFASEALPCQAGILRIGSFARKMAPGHLFVNAQAFFPLPLRAYAANNGCVSAPLDSDIIATFLTFHCCFAGGYWGLG